MLSSRSPRLGLALAVVALLGGVCERASAQKSVARRWNEALLDAIRIDFPAPTVHARNLYHSSAAMYDAWAAFEPDARGSFYLEKHAAGDVSAARDEAISYAAYRVLSERYTHAVDPVASQALFDDLMDELGYDPAVVTTVGDSPAALGNRIAAGILSGTLGDGSNEEFGYVDLTGYQPVNAPMTVDYPAVVAPDAEQLSDPNRWQPLYIDSALTQNGLLNFNLQQYIGPHWGDVTTFAAGRGDAGPHSWSAVDPGPPPQLAGVGDAEYRTDSVLIVEYSSNLDPTQGAGEELINISPNTTGARPLGTHDDHGYDVNPATGAPYADNYARRADYGRVLAEYWADGPDSETPPGHWNVIANSVSEHASLQKRIGGAGEVVDDLQWDVKMYLALNGAVHDAAVAAWGAKREYDYVRPITKIRYQGALGQSSDPELPSYHPDGLPLIDGLIELATADSVSPVGRHHNALANANRFDESGLFPDLQFDGDDLVGKIVVRSWNHEPEDPETELSGVDWVLAENWVPYQQDNFVTPAFAAYVSGHSTFSRAAAEVLAQFTGSEFFPDGLGEKTFDVDFLDFELGPSEEITLQWATYFDAADEAGVSRLWGGIHVPADDFAGRIMGSTIGLDAYDYAFAHYQAFALECDANGDLVVNLLDFNLLKESFGTDDWQTDFNADGTVNLPDFSLLKENFGAAAVPEPTSGLLLAAGLLAFWSASMVSAFGRRGFLQQPWFAVSRGRRLKC